MPVDVDIVANPKKVFAHELKETWCSPAGVQMTLAVLGQADTSDGFQRELQSRVKEWESYNDSHNGLWGPHAMALALEAYGAPGYEVRGYDSRIGALRDAAKAIQATNSPVILLAWRGAHTWVMTGFRADSDPSVFQYSKISGAYILDPWYPWNSSIWGQSDPPGTFQNLTRDGPELPAVEATRGPLPGPRRPVHRGRPDAQGAERTDADPAHARREEDREQGVLRDHPGRVAERDREDPGRGFERLAGDDDDAETGERGDDLAEGVVRRVQPARERIGERIERDRQGEGGDDQRRGRDVLGRELAAAQQDLDERAGEDVQRHGGERRQEPDRDEVADEDGPELLAVVIGEGGREDREDGQRERDADEAHRQDLVVEAEVEGRDGPDAETRPPSA